MACGWGKGYFGIQELGERQEARHLLRLGPGRGDDPKKVADEKRVEDAAQGRRRCASAGSAARGPAGSRSSTTTGRSARRTGSSSPRSPTATTAPRTPATSRAREEGVEAPRHVLDDHRSGEAAATGYYSFVEDFRRNKVSTTKARRATFGNGWVKPAKGEWVAADKARFTADANPVLNIDAGADGERFFLATGGGDREHHDQAARRR